MKINIFAIAALLSVQFAAAAAQPDSVTVTDIEKLVITESVEGLDVEITDKDSVVMNIHHEYSPNSKVISQISNGSVSLLGRSNKKSTKIEWDMTCGGFGVGFNAASGAPSAAGVEQGKSFGLSWMNILAVTTRNRFGNMFSIGVGVDWRNYRTTLDSRFNVSDGQVGVEEYPDGATPRLSRIKIFSVQFPVLWRQSLPVRFFRQDMHIVFGPVMNLNTHGSVLSSWHEDGRQHKESVNGINLRSFTVDAFVMVHFFEGGGLFFRYSPMKALTGRNDLNFHPLSTGIMFAM